MELLYLSNVVWNWTKQRPQFLAEELSKYYSLTYVQKKRFINEPVKNDGAVRIKTLNRLPLSRFRLIKIINNFLYKLQLYSCCRKTDIIWFTSPEMYPCIPSFFFKRKITVYDCMDDMIELYPTYKDMAKHEKYLYQNASIVFCSSSYLAGKLVSRYGKRSITVINNAVSSSFIESGDKTLPNKAPKTNDDTKVMTYIGSISSWMDFELLGIIHKNFPQIKIRLWGPHDVDIPADSGIDYCGVTEHKYVAGILSSSDILIMPFVVNELIKSVNPVKLYEYIYSGKPCVAPKYGESLQFAEFVNLYDSCDNCLSIIEGILKGKITQKPKERCEVFVVENTWSSRVLKIVDSIKILSA